MKNYFFILIGLFALVLMACTPEEEPDPDADTTPPTIQGATNKQLMLGMNLIHLLVLLQLMMLMVKSL